MAIKLGKHDMDELNVAILVSLITRDKMPTGMAVVTFAAFTSVDGALDFQSFSLSLISFLVN